MKNNSNNHGNNNTGNNLSISTSIRMINLNTSVGATNNNATSNSSVISSYNSSSLNTLRKVNGNIFGNQSKQLNFSSTTNINKSLNKDMFANSYSFPNKRESIAVSSLKFRRSGSITTFLPQENVSTATSINNGLNATIATINPTCITGTFNNSLPNFNNPNMLRNKFKSNFSPFHSKRHKTTNLSMIDYCNIINLNTSFQMLTNYYQEADDPMSRLTLKTNRNGNIQKQASIAEQMAILFGSTMCTCYLCKMKIVKNTKRHQKHHFEISPNKNNMDYSIIRYTYSSPYSQLSTLKLFNIMNTDCSIYFSPETNNNKINSNGPSTSNLNSFNSTNANTTITSNQYTTTNCNINANNISNANNASIPPVTCNATTYPLYSYNPLTTTIISTNANSFPNQSSTNINNNNNNSNNNSNNNNNNNSSNGLTLKNLMHVNTNTPPLYDPRYLYLIDCRLNKKQFKKHRIYTAIHYSDLLNDTVYLSPPTENYTLIVLYDENGLILTSSSSAPHASTNNMSRLSNQTFNSNENDNESEELFLNNEINPATVKSDEIISAIRAKLNCNATQTIYILSGGYDEFYSKFPFMCSNIDIRSTVDRNKYLTVYPNCVIENQMYIGSGIQAKNWKIIRDLNITHIINCSIEHECVFQDELTYLHVKLEDNHQENIYKFLTRTLRFIEEAFDKYYEEVYKSENSIDFSIDSGINSATSSKSSNINSIIKSQSQIRPPVFLIHCNLGISRSSSILIAYLISKYRLCLYSAFKYVKDKRLQIAPNYSFLKQLKQFEDTVF